MWRAFFSAVGIVLIILGVECLMIDSAVLAAGVVEEQAPLASGGIFSSAPLQMSSNRIFKPAEWIPWSLLASGAIILLYSISLRRNQGA